MTSRYATESDAAQAGYEALSLLTEGTSSALEQDRKYGGGYSVRVQCPPWELRSPRPGRWTAIFYYRQVGQKVNAVEADVLDSTPAQAMHDLLVKLKDTRDQINAGLKYIDCANLITK